MATFTQGEEWPIHFFLKGFLAIFFFLLSTLFIYWHKKKIKKIPQADDGEKKLSIKLKKQTIWYVILLPGWNLPYGRHWIFWRVQILAKKILHTGEKESVSQCG